MENKPSIVSTNANAELFDDIKSNNSEEMDKVNEKAIIIHKASTINYNTKMPDLYVHQFLLIEYVEGELDNQIKLKEYIEQQIENDKIIERMVRGIKLDKKKKYKVSREVFLQENKIKFEARMNEIDILRKPSLLEILLKFLKSLIIPIFKKRNPTQEGVIYGFTASQHNSNGLTRFFKAPPWKKTITTIVAFSFILSVSSIVLNLSFCDGIRTNIFGNNQYHNSNDSQSKEPNNTLSLLDIGLPKSPLKGTLTIKNKTNSDNDHPPKNEKMKKLNIGKGIINNGNIATRVILKEEKKAQAVLAATGNQGTIVTPPAPEILVNITPKNLYSLQGEKDESSNFWNRLNNIGTSLNTAMAISSFMINQDSRDVNEVKIPLIDSYLYRFAPIAIKEMKNNNILASILLGTAIVFSDWGRHDDAIYSNNHFMMSCNIDFEDKNIITSMKDIKKEVSGHCLQAFPIPEASYERFTKLITSLSTIKKKNQKLTTTDWIEFFETYSIIEEKEILEEIKEVITKHDLERFDNNINFVYNTKDDAESIPALEYNFRQNYYLWSFMNRAIDQIKPNTELMSYTIKFDRTASVNIDNLTDLYSNLIDHKTPLGKLKLALDSEKKKIEKKEILLNRYLPEYQKICSENKDFQLVLFSKPNSINKNKKHYNIGAIKDKTMFLARLQNPPKLALNK